jgi:hypothetical protein
VADRHSIQRQGQVCGLGAAAAHGQGHPGRHEQGVAAAGWLGQAHRGAALVHVDEHVGAIGRPAHHVTRGILENQGQPQNGFVGRHRVKGAGDEGDAVQVGVAGIARHQRRRVGLVEAGAFHIAPGGVGRAQVGHGTRPDVDVAGEVGQRTIALGGVVGDGHLVGFAEKHGLGTQHLRRNGEGKQPEQHRNKSK